MSLVRLTTVNCDGHPQPDGRVYHDPECPFWIGNEDSAAAARHLAKLAGWVRVGTGRNTLDYSPACWAAVTH